MAMWPTIIGFSLWGLASRFGQLGIQKRNLFSNPSGHLIAMGVFGYAGYWAHVWDVRAAEILEEKQAHIKEQRQRKLEKLAAEASAALGDAA